MKGKKKAEKKLQKIVNSLPHVKGIKIRLSDCWECIIPKKKVFVSPFITSIGSKQNTIWKEWVEDTYNFTVDNIFMLSLLHEIGHIKTYEKFAKKEPATFNFSEDETEACDEISAHLCLSGLTDTQDFIDVCRRYHEIPTEKIATDWAIKYIKKYNDIVEDTFNKMCVILFKFYQKNNVSIAE